VRRVCWPWGKDSEAGTKGTSGEQDGGLSGELLLDHIKQSQRPPILSRAPWQPCPGLAIHSLAPLICRGLVVGGLELPSRSISTVHCNATQVDSKSKPCAKEHFLVRAFIPSLSLGLACSRCSPQPPSWAFVWCFECETLS
jgi:hypothetical protein